MCSLPSPRERYQSCKTDDGRCDEHRVNATSGQTDKSGATAHILHEAQSALFLVDELNDSVSQMYFKIVLSALVLASSLFTAHAQDSELDNFGERIKGSWVINDDLSDDTDDKVEDAIKEAGGKASRGFFNNSEDFYRGGPPEHELYDRLSYDDVLTIQYDAPEFSFAYEDEFQRIFHTDGRRRRTTAADFYNGSAADWSFGYFDGQSLIVEGQPRDGGFTIETYTLSENGNRLRIEMLIQPDSFAVPINLVRVFDRR